MTTNTYQNKKLYFSKENPLPSEMDDEVIEEKAKLKKSKVIEALKSKSCLDYGKTINKQTMEQIAGTTEEEVGYKQWQFIFLMFWNCCESEGYFPTSRGKNGDIYLFSCDEMAYINEKKNKNLYRKLQQRQKSLYMIPRDQIQKKEVEKKLEFEINRNADFILKIGDKLKERCV